MRYSFAFLPEGPLEDVLDLVDLGEELGFDRVWLPDQTFYRDPFTLLAVCAQRTKRIELGLGVTNPYTRSPVQTARIAATLDEISGGRFALCYGAGNNPEMLRPLGIEQTRAAARCREAVVVTKRLVAGERLEYRSETLIADGVQLITPGRADMHVYIAGRSPGTLSAAGEVADGAIVGGLFTMPRLRAGLSSVEAGAKKAGRTLGDVRIVLWGSCHIVGPDKDMTAFRVGIAKVIGRAREDGLVRAGLDPDRITHLKALGHESGPGVVADELTLEELNLFSLIGTAEECRRRIAELEREGVQEMAILLREAPVEEHITFLREFMTGVAGLA